MKSLSVFKEEGSDVLNEFVTRTPNSRKIWGVAKKVFPSGLNRDSFFYSPYPAFAKNGRGSVIVDVDGNEYVDLCFNFTSLILGHKHPKVISAVLEQLENGTALGAPTGLEYELGKRITKRMPSVEKIRFTVTGSESVLLATRLARAFSNRNKIVKFEGGYHGSIDSAMVSLHRTGSSNVQSPQAHADSEGLAKGTVSDTIVLDYNNSNAAEKRIKAKRKEIAAVIVEPVMRAIEPRADFLKHLKEICSTNDVLLIFDEVVTGFRVAPGGAQEKYQVEPDLTAMGKIIGGGFPLGAVGGREEIMSLIEYGHKQFPEVVAPRVPHYGTFNAHPISLAAGKVTLDELTYGSYQRMNGHAETIRRGLKKILAHEKIEAKVYGTASLFHIAFSKEEVTNYASAHSFAGDSLISYFDMCLLNRGVFLPPKHFGCTSVVTSKRDVDKALLAMGKSIGVLRNIVKRKFPELLKQS